MGWFLVVQPKGQPPEDELGGFGVQTMGGAPDARVHTSGGPGNWAWEEEVYVRIAHLQPLHLPRPWVPGPSLAERMALWPPPAVMVVCVPRIKWSCNADEQTHTHTICKQTTEQHNAGSECQFLVSWSSNKTKHVQRQ